MSEYSEAGMEHFVGRAQSVKWNARRVGREVGGSGKINNSETPLPSVGMWMAAAMVTHARQRLDLRLMALSIPSHLPWNNGKGPNSNEHNCTHQCGLRSQQKKLRLHSVHWLFDRCVVIQSIIRVLYRAVSCLRSLSFDRDMISLLNNMPAYLHLQLQKLSHKHAGFEILKGLSRLRPLWRKKNPLYSGVRGHSKVEFQGLFFNSLYNFFGVSFPSSL